MKLPTSVKVGAWEYRIERWDTRDAVRENKLGEADHTLRIIKIDQGWGEKRAAATLLHEILHCIWVCRGMEERDEAERIVSTFEDGLSAVWHDSPEVMCWIGAGLKR